MRRHGIIILTAGLLALAQPSPARAQPSLVSASPAPDSILLASPAVITLTFDQVLVRQGARIDVTNEPGDYVQTGEVIVDPASQFTLTVPLPTLIEGRYTVSYAVASVGSSTLLVGGYDFTVDLPPPRLALITPVDGQAYETGMIRLQMRTDYFDFGQFDNRIRVYVDGVAYSDVRSLEYVIEDLAPGVHELRTVLTQFDDRELPETAITVHVAVAQPDPETEGWERAAVAQPDPGLHMDLSQVIITTVVTTGLLLLGIWIGRTAQSGGRLS